MKTKNLFKGLLLALPMIAAPLHAQSLKLSANNIDAIVKAMTLDEKATLLVGGPQDRVPGAAGGTRAIPRLGIPQVILSDGPAGLRIDWTRKGTDKTFYTTAFPIGSCLAATWNTSLVHDACAVLGIETREMGVDVLLAPGANIHRNPLCGRNFEYLSEDPVLAGNIAAAYIQGVQSAGVGTSLKHFAANSQETNRLEVDAIVPTRAMREIYLKNFEIAIHKSNPWTVMSSYNRLSGPYAQASRELLTDVLRTDWGFKGIVMTDWIGRRNTTEQIYAGSDLLEPGEDVQIKDIVEGVKSGKLNIKDVDIDVKRILEFIVKTPSFRNYKYSGKIDFAKSALVAREGGNEGLVLLKNDNATLPLRNVKTAAFFGAGSYRSLGMGWGSGTVNPDHCVNIIDGFKAARIESTANLKDIYEKAIAFSDVRQKAEREQEYEWYPGRIQYPEITLNYRAVEEQAKLADVAIFTITREAGEGWDRSVSGDKGFNLTADEQQLLERVSDNFHKVGKKVVVVINSGSVINTASWKHLADGILLAWQPGEEVGYCVADIVTGRVNPSGKLPMTWPNDIMDHPSSKCFPTTAKDNDKVCLYKEGINVGYRYFETAGKPVSYPFGYGLSYTTFNYRDLKVKPTGKGFTAQVTVINTGRTAGKEVVQLYVTAPKGTIEKPVVELKAFGKTRLLQPGEKQTLTFTVADYDLASFHEASSQWVADAGTYVIKAAAAVDDIRATATYKLKKTFNKKVSNVLKPSREL